MKSLLKYIGIIVLAFLYALGMGSGYYFIYSIGIKEIVIPFYELPSIPITSFLIMYTIVLFGRSIYNKKKKESYDLSDPKPYGIMLSKIMTIYMYVLIIGIFDLIF